MNTDTKKKLDVLNAVWLYDEDEECRRMVDESAEYGVYAHEALRKHDATLHSYGEDYARAAAPQLAEEPMGFVESVLAGMPEERRGVYQGEFDRLKLSGKDTRQDYYALFGKMVRDEVRGKYAEQKRVQKQNAERLDKLVGETLAGRGWMPTPEDYALLTEAGFKYKDLMLAGAVANAARMGMSEEQQADMLFEQNASPAARQMALQQIAADALEEERKTGERGFFENMAGSLSHTAEAITDVAKSVLPSGRNMLHADMMRGSDGKWLNAEQLSAKVTNRAAWRQRMREAIEQGRGKAREEIGFRVSSMPSNLATGLVRLAPWLVPGIGQGAAVGGLITDSFSHGYGVQQAARDEGDNSVGDGQVLGKTLAATIAGSVPMYGGSWLVRNGVGRLMPRSMTWGARALSKAPVAYAANVATTTATFGAVLPTVEYGLNAIYDVMPYTHDKLDTGVNDFVQLGKQMGTGAYWAEQGLLGAVLGAPATGATRMRAMRYLGNLKGALSEGITRKQFESTVHMKPAEQMEALEKIRRKNMEEDAEGTIKRAVAENKAAFDREKAVQWRTDKAIMAAMEASGFSVEAAEREGMVNLYYGGEVGADGVFKRGEKYVTLSREDAEVYLQGTIGYKLEGMAGVLRQAAGGKRLLDAFREKLKGDVRVEWMREADSLAKYEVWKERALERIETRTAELAAEGMGAAEARRTAEGEVHKDISDRGTLGELVSFATNMRERFEQEQAAAGRPLDPSSFDSRANVTRQKSADGRQLRRVLRIATDARVDEVAEELGEQVMYDWREAEGMSVTEAYKYLRKFADWAAKSDNAAVAKAAGKLLSLDKTHPELAERIMQEGFNEYDLTVDEYRAVERELTEAGSTLMLSELRQAAADGNLPGWVRELFGVADLNLLELERDVNLAMAMAQARAEGVLPEAAQKLFGVGREAVEAALREEPEAQEYHRAWYEVERRQRELDAAYGAGKLTEPSITEAFEERARRGQEALDAAREAEEERAAEAARERVEEFAAEAENEGKSHEEVVREVAERAADAAQERLEGEPGKLDDADFAGGLCLEITDEGGLVCKSGLLEVGKLQVLPNFKLGADADSGVVHPLKGDYRPDHDPIRVWRKADGALLVISGRHRLDAAKRAGATRISAYVYDESEVRDLAWARRYDIEGNIRDNQASALEVAMYVRGEFTDGKPLSNEEVEQAGIDREGKLGSIGLRIGRRAGESVLDALRNGKIDDRVALWIADFCPGNDAVQRRGLEAALRDASKAEVLARMEAELAKQQMQEEMGLDGGTDLFGNTLDNDEFMDFVAQYVVRRRNELAQDATYLNTTAKKRNAEAMGKKYGVDVKDPVALKKKLEELNALRERWKSPYSDSELMDEIRAAWRGREGAGVQDGAAGSPDEQPSERLFREYAAMDWKTERTDYSIMDESKRYVSDKDGNPVSYDELIMRSRMAHEELFVEVMKNAPAEMREAVANIEAVLAGKMDKGFRYRDLSAEEVAFFMERTGVDFAGYEWRIIPSALLHENKRTDEKRGWALTDTELKLLPYFIDRLMANKETLAVSIGDVNSKGVRSMIVELENPITKAKMVFEASSKKHTARPYKTKKAPRLSLSSAKMLLIQRAGLAPASTPKSVPSGEATLAENAGDVKQNLLKQEFSSRDTSININKTPAVYSMVDKIGGWRSGAVNIDIGGGKYDTLTQALADKGVTSYIYEPYGRTNNENAYILSQLQSKELQGDTATCSNVLNVIKEADVRSNVILQVSKAIKPDGVAYFTIYEGKGNGRGAVSKNDCWQNNRKSDTYVDEVQQHFADVQMRGKLIVARKPLHPETAAEWRQGAEGGVVHFSVIGAKAVTWDKYRDRMFTGRDDGMLRAEIDASQARLLPVMKPESAYKTEVKRAVRLLFERALSTPEYEKKQRARRLALTTQSSMVFGTKLGDSEAWNKLQGFICDGKEPGAVLRELGLSEDSVYSDIVSAQEAAEAEYKESCREMVGMIGVSGRNFEMAFNHVTGRSGREHRRTADDWEGLGDTLGDVLDYPELYAAYPALRDVKMQYRDGYGSYSRIPRGGGLEEAEIVLGTDKTPEQMRSTLLHELQHLIQLHEDFAFGGTPSNVRGIFERLGRQDELGAVEDVEADYDRLAGEIEARAVSKRQFMSAEERAGKPFNEMLEHEGNVLTYRLSEYYAAVDAARGNVTHYSICGLKAKTAAEYLEKGADYVDPADGQRKFVIPVSGARLRSDVTPGMLNVAAGGHKDVSLAALLHYPELYRAYPQLAEMRVRLFRPLGETNVGGYFSPEVGSEQAAYIAVNVASRLEVLNTLLHESQHAIQQLEGFAMGAGSFDQGMALAYLGQAIEQRRAAGVNDDWSRDNMAYLERLREGVEKGSEDAVIMTYLMSHGEQEARYTGLGHGAVGENPTAEGAADGLTGGAPSSYTVAVRTNATDLGGVTFLNMGRFGYLMDSRLMPAGEFNYDRRVYQMRENIMRRMRELRAQTDGAEEADGLRLAAEGLAVMDSVEALLPNTYRAALEPYKVYFNTYAKLRGSGDAGKAAATVPMKGWDARMFGSFYGIVYRLISGKAEAHGEFWEHAFRDVPGAEEGMEVMREVWEEVHEQVAEEYAERLADAPNAKGRRKIEALIEQETFSRIELQFSEEMNKLFQALGSMRADRLMAKFLERVALQLDAFRKDTTLGRIRRVVDGLTPLPGKDGKPVKGRMAADAYKKVMDMMRLLELTKGERLAFERTRYTGDEDCPDGTKEWADVAPDEIISVDTYEADGTAVKVHCTKQEYETYACFDGMTAAQAESAGKALGEFITTGRQAWDNKEEARKQRIAKMCAPLMEKYAESPNDERRRLHKEKRGQLPHEKGWLTREGFARRIHSMFGSWMNDAQFFDAMTGVKEVEGFARDFTDRMARAKVYIESKEKERRAVMMDAVFEASGAKTGKEARAFIDYINRTEQTGIELKPQEPDFLEQETAELRAQFMGLLRRKTHKKNFRPNTFAAMMQHLADAGEDVVPAHIMEEAEAKYGEIGDAKKSVLQGAQAMASVLTAQEYERFHNMTKAAKKRADKAREKWLEKQKKKGGKTRPGDGSLELTRSEAAYRVLLCKQADYEETLRRQGYTEAVVRQLEEFAGERMMRLAYRLRDELGARTPQIKEVYERVYGMPFPEVENYFRAYFDAGYEVRSEAIMGGAGEGRAAGKGTAKILYTRHHHNAKIDPTMNVLGAFECAMKEQDIMLGYGDLPTDISQVLNYRDGDLRMSDALAKVFSTHTVGEMQLIADNMTRAVPAAEETARWMTRCLSAMGSSTATAVLNYRAGTLFKQGTALFNTLAGSDRVSWWEWHKSAGRTNCGLGKISLKEMAARPELDGRFKGWAASVNAEALLGDADVVSAKGATNAAARAGMSLMEWIDMRANVRACATLYDAVYRKMQKEYPEMSHEELDADAINEVRRALAFKSQPLDWRSRALLGGKRSLFTIGNLFLGGESINTMGNVLRLMARAKRKRDWGKAAYVWLEHGIALQVLTYIYNWMTDDEEQWERRSWKQYVAGSALGPLAGLPLVSAFVGAGTGVLNTFLPKEWRVWMPSQSLLPMADMERVASDLRKVFCGKKPSSWQDKMIAVENLVRVIATFGILASRNPTSAGGAKVKAISYSVAAVTNILDFLLRTERAFEERVLD